MFNCCSPSSPGQKEIYVNVAHFAYDLAINKATQSMSTCSIDAPASNENFTLSALCFLMP